MDCITTTSSAQRPGNKLTRLSFISIVIPFMLIAIPPAQLDPAHRDLPLHLHQYTTVQCLVLQLINLISRFVFAVDPVAPRPAAASEPVDQRRALGVQVPDPLHPQQRVPLAGEKKRRF